MLRYANVVGPRLRHGIVYDLLVKLKRDRNKLEVLSDRKQVRSYVYTEDALDASISAYERSKGTFEVYNVASEDYMIVDEVGGVI